MNIRDGKLYVDWCDIDAFSLDIAHEAKKLGIEKVVGVARGGLVPGVIISHTLNVPFESLAWQTRDGDTRDAEKAESLNSDKVLIVDDLIDSGKTMMELEILAPYAHKAVIFNKQIEIPIDIVGHTLYDVKEWIVFPWEQ
tara:strand:+ start:5662 stop:6081 length:420 start_codon:yes stop_codon:yes gene_type:complete